jgi:ATP-binding cassette subfamily B protein
VRHADWIYVLDEGRIAEEGRHEDLLRKKGIYANLWRIQTGESVAPPRAKTPRKRK